MALYRPATALRNRMSCRVCYEEYDNKSHVPIMLPCQHTFCQSCLSKIADRNSEKKCPLCKTSHSVPQSGFPTNRAVLDIIEELNKGRQPRVLKCEEHDNKECVLICIKCEKILCAKCIKQGGHKSHRMEEPEEAKSVLSDALDKIVKTQQSKLKKLKSTIDKSPYTVTGLENAIMNISSICDHIVELTIEWRDRQLKLLEDMKLEASKERLYRKASKATERLSSHNNSDVECLITNLQKARSNEKVLKSCEEKKNYNFSGEHQMLTAKISSVFPSIDALTSNPDEISPTK